MSGLIRSNSGISDVTTEAAGLGSVLSPSTDFAKTLNESDGVRPVGPLGSTLWSSVVAPVPRAFWPDKPDGFGSDLAEHFYPGSKRNGHSVAALIHGEMVWSFGLLAALAADGMIVIAYSGLWRLVKGSRVAAIGGAELFQVVMVSGVMDLYWVGTFTFVSRSGFRLFWLLAILYVIKLLPSKSRLPSFSERRLDVA